LDAVNPDRAVPNVLVQVNNDDRCGSLDLIGAVTGRLLLEGSDAVPIYMRYSGGRIRTEKCRVDLYLWCDARRVNQLVFNMTDRRHLAKIGELFDVDPDSIPTISA
jgi:hypothetical protein